MLIEYAGSGNMVFFAWFGPCAAHFHCGRDVYVMLRVFCSTACCGSVSVSVDSLCLCGCGGAFVTDQPVGRADGGHDWLGPKDVFHCLFLCAFFSFFYLHAYFWFDYFLYWVVTSYSGETIFQKIHCFC